MNLVDLCILGIAAVSLIFGLYKGFIGSVFGLLNVFVAMFLAYRFAPLVVEWVSGNPTILNTLLYYTDASSRLGDLSISQTLVSGLSQGGIAEIISRADLPGPFSMLLEANMLEQVYGSLPNATVSEYLNQTIISAIIHIFSYVAVFALGYGLLTVVLNMLQYVFKFPVLRQFDMLLGGVFGLARGVFLLYILFALMPIVMTIVPFPQLTEAVEQSQFGSVLLESRIIETIIKGQL